MKFVFAFTYKKYYLFQRKTLSLAFLLLVYTLGNAQTEVKVNALFAPLTILNVAVEKPVSDHFALQGEVFVSPWKSITGRHLQIYLGTAEARYYFGGGHTKWFVGGYFSGGVFDLQKWNYWNKKQIVNENGDYMFNADGTPRITSLYQRGFALVFGIDAGYKFKISERLNLEAFVGIGSIQGFYHGYFADTGTRYETAENWNKSGEIIPTRGGIMFSYVFR
ncbi:DUF3575 domain-containing protein [Chryseobacterium sp. Leaf394]|uniref:DUF3575 domain-containing protein n=1 Tax=Chryseobacterium sp. Leaf394 TaxID=1736361 RepID=UPI0007001546|nr:DUF3575 domain-containing protein [Chryseobacterium sp. Leaf394]KQS93192.1 hypothetical protein ASG21_12435 [Chryseobacterium sp. Leaf394]